ncbi:MAG: hypothetical protein JWP36_1288 [Paucimonas sp.]|nr:hypothetical protein [Paucimonas sp.]
MAGAKLVADFSQGKNMKTFHCDRCNQQVFFENVWCENCGGMLGYQPEHRAISTFEPAGGDKWRSLNPVNEGRLYRQCRNYALENVCNWMIEAGDEGELCASCKLTRVIPSLNKDVNRLYWNRLETAKRRLLYSLWQLHLQPQPKDEDEEEGMAFEFLEDTPREKVMTGHASGVITINVAEADPARREEVRELMHEPYRTLLGHFRHESGHYYFDRLITGNPERLAQFREMFGDEREDYAQALQRHYARGDSGGWEQQHVTSYASSHPWEDWAETWAHYLHMFDSLDTAFACGVKLEPKKADEPVLELDSHPLATRSWDQLSTNWFALTYLLNNLNRSIGMPDPYPFALSPQVQKKLQFVHEVVREHATRARHRR